jgi:hypothetical protein
VVAPDGQIHAQTDMKQEQLLVTDIDIDKATRAMFDFGCDGFDQNLCTELFYGDTVHPDEYVG